MPIRHCLLAACYKVYTLAAMPNVAGCGCVSVPVHRSVGKSELHAAHLKDDSARLLHLQLWLSITMLFTRLAPVAMALQ